MSRIRDLGNILSGSTDAATDAEVTAAIAAHNSLTTSVHGISNTANLATSSSVSSSISAHATAANGHISRGNTSSRPATPTAGDVYANTETGFMEVYTGATYGWEQIGGIASTVTGVTATNQGSGRAYNNGQASISFTPGTIAGRTYTVTPNPATSPATFSGTSSPVTVTGLASATSYTYTITASNNYGTSSASSASSGVTATTVPQAPTIGSPTAGDTQVSLAFTAGNNGGSSITNYKYSLDNSTYTAFSPAQTSSPVTITGLTNGTAYQFYLKAVNANGDSLASGQSSSVTPSVGTGFYSISTATVDSGGASTITFSNIPQYYTHLQLRGLLFGTDAQADSLIRFNSDSGSNYTLHQMYGNGASAASSNNVPRTSILSGMVGDTPTTFGGITITDILDYTNTNKYTTTRSLQGVDRNGSGGYILFRSGLWVNTSAITDITITVSPGTFTQYTQFALYGVK